MTDLHEIRLTVDGTETRMHCAPRELLSDALRERIGAQSVHVGCEHGMCGACTVELDGRTVRSCLMLAVQADGCAITTVASLGGPEGALHPLQEAFTRNHAVQCGFCTPGMIMTAKELLDVNPEPSEAEIRTAIAGNLCRCTGYGSIVKAIADAARRQAPGADIRPADA